MPFYIGSFANEVLVGDFYVNQRNRIILIVLQLVLSEFMSRLQKISKILATIHLSSYHGLHSWNVVVLTYQILVAVIMFFTILTYIID